MHAADFGRHAGAPGTEAEPWGQVPTSNFPGSPRAEPEPSQCLSLAAWLTSRHLHCFQVMLTTQGLDCHRWLAVEAGQALPLLPLLGLVPCRTLQHTRHYLKIKTCTFADLCDFHCNWALMRETIDDRETGTTTNCSVLHRVPRGGSNCFYPRGFRKGFSNQSWIWILKEGHSR